MIIRYLDFEGELYARIGGFSKSTRPTSRAKQARACRATLFTLPMNGRLTAARARVSGSRSESG